MTTDPNYKQEQQRRQHGSDRPQAMSLDIIQVLVTAAAAAAAATTTTTMH